jgi:hypothetical protein
MKDPCNRFLKKDGFVIIACNREDPSQHGPFEAWAYRGPLDLQTAVPVTFGVGICVADALDALKHHLKGPRQGDQQRALARMRLLVHPDSSVALKGDAHAEED